MFVKSLLASAILFSSIASFAASGTFRGTLIQDPVTQDSHKWVYLQSANGSVRRVEISHAQLVYAEEISRKAHPLKPSEALRKGAGLRITASQDQNGEWAATRVEIVEISPN